MSGRGAIAAIVVTHESGATLPRCLEALRRASGVAEIAIVDNGSRDGALERLSPLPTLHVIRNADNPGFARACNQGAAATTAEWIAFVNPDCEVEPEALARMRDAAGAFAPPVLVGADVRGVDGAPERAARRRDPSFARVLAHLVGRERYDGLPPEPPLTRVDAVSGALMLIARRDFDALGGFDAGYRLHCEDLDLCRRVREAGGTVLVAEDARALHLKGVSSRRRPLFVAWHKHRGMARYYGKFEARQHGAFTRALVRAGLVAHAAWALLLAVPAQWRASRRR